jgi:hypothetical protein
MQYTIALVLATVLSTVFLGANFSNWNNSQPLKDIVVKKIDSTDVPKVELNDENNKLGIDLNRVSVTESEAKSIGTVADQRKAKNEIKHDLSCLNEDEDLIGFSLEIGRSMEDLFMKNLEVEVSVQEEIKVGEESKKTILAKSSLLNDSRYVNRIDRIMKKLLAELDNPKFNYKWYVVNEDIINAMTSGGNIFIFKGIIDFAEDDDELAAILAHEIYHNELGHIADHIKKENISRGIFGEFNQIPLIAATVLTLPNNQFNEANCDLYGIDLCERAGYDGCHAEKLWQRMKEQEGDRMAFEKLFSTHPFSKDRANCINKHMKENYNRSCNH